MRPGKVGSSLPRGVGPLPDWRGDCGFAVAVLESLSGSRLREETKVVPAKVVQLSLSPGLPLGDSSASMTDLPLKEASRDWWCYWLSIMQVDLLTFMHWIYNLDSLLQINFHIPGLTKTTRSGPPKEAFFVKFADDEALCSVKALKVYEEKTTMLRVVDPTEPAPLLTSFRKPHKPVSSASIALWMKELLKEAVSVIDIRYTSGRRGNL